MDTNSTRLTPKTSTGRECEDGGTEPARAGASGESVAVLPVTSADVDDSPVDRHPAGQ